MSETIVIVLMAVGGIITLLGTLWLLIRAFRTSILWGIVCFAFAPAFILTHLKRSWAPVLVMLLGAGVAISGPAYNKFFPPPVQDTAQEFEGSITLTGAIRSEYAKLNTGKRYGVIQWANKDVTDDDAAVLVSQSQLTELDLNDTQVTNRTLILVTEIQTIKVLRIARTKVTAEAVKMLILDNPESKIVEIDVRGLVPPVPGKALRDWKAKDKDNRKFIN